MSVVLIVNRSSNVRKSIKNNLGINGDIPSFYEIKPMKWNIFFNKNKELWVSKIC